ncbi:MAG TPA: DUF6766 family protein [Nitrospiraceae bacterium]|nr:DUF6766 family protein [Nitrospiraceae bacterium]
MALSIVLLACFLGSWLMQAWTGWMKFAAEQQQHNQLPTVFGSDGYIWEFAAATFENWQSEFLQLLAMVVLTSFLIHRGSAESKDSNDRLEAKVDALQKAVDGIAAGNRRAKQEERA